LLDVSLNAHSLGVVPPSPFIKNLSPFLTDTLVYFQLDKLVADEAILVESVPKYFPSVNDI